MKESYLIKLLQPAEFKKYFAHINADTSAFRDEVLPLLSKEWQKNCSRLVDVMQSWVGKLNNTILLDCIAATKKYINSSNFPFSGRYKTTSLFYGGIKYTRETDALKKLNSEIDTLYTRINSVNYVSLTDNSTTLESFTKIAKNVADLVWKKPWAVVVGLLSAHAIVVSALSPMMIGRSRTMKETQLIDKPPNNNVKTSTPTYFELSDTAKKFEAIQPLVNNNSTAGINLLVLKGTQSQMGIKYGKIMRARLNEVLNILKEYYVAQHSVPYEKLVAKANVFYEKYPYPYQRFIKGMAQGSGLSIDDCKVLNAMETLNSVIGVNSIHWCSFMTIPGSKTTTNSTIVGRNYDFPPPFDKCAKYLTVTVLLEEDKIPTALISMPGQIYCPSCLNSEGLFMELNNGMPSGGSYVNDQRQSLLINMLQTMQNSETLSQAEKQMRATKSDYSLVVNTADKRDTKSYEFSSTQGMKPYFPPKDEVFVSTNFFLNKTWEKIPSPFDNNTWFGVTRRNNLLKLAGMKEKHSISTIMSLMDKNLEEGGARWDLTIYQIIFDSNSLDLYLKVPNLNANWTKIALSSHFRNMTEAESCIKSNIFSLTGGLLTGGFVVGLVSFGIFGASECMKCIKDNKKDEEKTPLLKHTV